MSEDSKCGDTGGWTEVRGHRLFPKRRENNEKKKKTHYEIILENIL